MFAQTEYVKLPSTLKELINSPLLTKKSTTTISNDEIIRYLDDFNTQINSNTKIDVSEYVKYDINYIASISDFGKSLKNISTNAKSFENFHSTIQNVLNTEKLTSQEITTLIKLDYSVQVFQNSHNVDSLTGKRNWNCAYGILCGAASGAYLGSFGGPWGVVGGIIVGGVIGGLANC